MASPTPPQINGITVRNFGCLRDVNIRLSPLTVLVGPNDSGKSTLLRALATLGSACRSDRGWQDVFPDEEAHRKVTFEGEGGPIHFELEGALDEAPFHFTSDVRFHRPYAAVVSDETLTAGVVNASRALDEFTFRNKAGVMEGPVPWTNSSLPLLYSHSIKLDGTSPLDFLRFGTFLEPARPLANMARSLRRFVLRPEDLRRPLPLRATRIFLGEARMRISPTGLGLSHALLDLLRKERNIYERIETSLRRSMPFVGGIDIDEIEVGIGDQKDIGYTIELRTKSGARVSGDAMSDGVLLYLAYLYLIHTASEGLLIIEEPETGIHPALLKEVVSLIRDLTVGKHGVPATRVLMTTHSPILLNEILPNEIRVVRRGERGGTTITEFNKADNLDRLLTYQGPGEIWVNEGEDFLAKQGASS